MTTITEGELIDNAKNGAVTAIKVLPDAQKGKGFNLFVNLTWKEGDLLLVTQQKHPRNWVSVDRLLEHIAKNYSKVASLTIFLRGKNEDENSS